MADLLGYSELYPHLEDHNGTLKLDYDGLNSAKELPLVLCGPVLRRVQPTSVSVWVALQDSRKISLKIDRGGNSTDTSYAQWPVEVSENLHIAVVTIDSNLSSDLQPGTVYKYDLLVGDDEKSLNEAGILSTSQGGLKRIHPDPSNWGNKTDREKLPGFSLPPKDKNDVRLFHASCRKPHGEKRGTLSAVHKALKKNEGYKDPTNRPHMLFLTGDQIYGDDVADQLFAMIWNHARGLRGGSDEEKLPTGDGEQKLGESHPDNRQAFVDDTADLTALDGYGTSHLFGLSEYLAMYLCAWSDVLWPDENHVRQDAHNDDQSPAFPTIREVYARGDSSQTDDPPLPSHVVERSKEEYSSDDIPDYLTGQPTWSDVKSAGNQGWQNVLKSEMDAYGKNLGALHWFRTELPKVRRLLANVPTYMMWDDHEVTDDWFISGKWVAQVLGNEAGHRIVQNGMVAACLCQMWGNNPNRYGKMLASSNVASAIPVDASGDALLAHVDESDRTSEKGTYVNTDADSSASESVDKLLGIPTLSDAEGGDIFEPSAWHRAPDDSRLRYHFGFCPGDYAVAILDTRTWRAYKSPKQPPEVISTHGQLTQFADINSNNSAWYAGEQWDRDTPLITASAVPMWTPIIAGYGQEWMRYLKRRKKKLVKSVRASFQEQPSYDPELIDATPYADYEHWRLQRGAMEHYIYLLSKMSKYPVVLSGDVHYGGTSRAEYWYNYDKKLMLDSATWNPSAPWGARIANLTSSAAKNESTLSRALHGSGYVYTTGLASLGWYNSAAPKSVQEMTEGTSWKTWLVQRAIMRSLYTDSWRISAQDFWQRYVVEPLPEDKIKGNTPWKLYSQKKKQVKKLIEDAIERVKPSGYDEHSLTNSNPSAWDTGLDPSILTKTMGLNGWAFNTHGLVNVGSILFASDASWRFNIANIPINAVSPVPDLGSGPPFLQQNNLANLDVDYINGDLVVQAQRVRAEEVKSYLEGYGFVTVTDGLLSMGQDAFQDLAGRTGYNLDVPQRFFSTDYYIELVADVQGTKISTTVIPDSGNKKSVESGNWLSFKRAADTAKNWWNWATGQSDKKAATRDYAAMKKGLKPHWEYRVDYLRGVRNFYDSSLSASEVSPFRTAKDFGSFVKDGAVTGRGDPKEVESEWEDYSDETSDAKWGSEIVGHNNVGEVTFNFGTTQKQVDNETREVAIREVNHTLWWRIAGTEQLHPYTTYKVDLRADAKGVPVRQKGVPTGTTQIRYSGRPSSILQRTYGDPDKALPGGPKPGGSKPNSRQVGGGPQA